MDYVPSLDNGVLIQVTGVMHLLRDKQPSVALRSFAQSFLLVSTAESSYAIRNDILRFLPYHEPAAAQQAQAPAAAPAHETADASTETVGLKSPLQQAARAPTPAPAPLEAAKQASPEPARSNMKSPKPAPAAAPAHIEPVTATPAAESKPAEEHKSVDIKPTAQPAAQQPAPAAEQHKEAEEVKQPEPATPQQQPQQAAKKSRAVAPAKPPSWAALLSKDSKSSDSAAADDTAVEEAPAAESQQKPTKQASTEGGKPAHSPTSGKKGGDSRIDRKDDLKVGQSKFGNGYRPTGFFGKPTLEQVQASVVINAVPDDITHGQLRDVVEREIAPVRNLHQPQGKKFIVVYFNSRPETEKALAQSTVIVNNHTLKLTVNTYRPTMGGGGGGGGGNFPDRRREAAPEQSRRAFANEPDAEGFVTQSKKSAGGSGRGALRGGLSFGGGRGGRGGFQAKSGPKTNGVANESA